MFSCSESNVDHLGLGLIVLVMIQDQIFLLSSLLSLHVYNFNQNTSTKIISLQFIIKCHLSSTSNLS